MSDQGGKAHGIDIRCETALLLNRKGSLREEVWRSQRPPKEGISDRDKMRLSRGVSENDLDPGGSSLKNKGREGDEVSRVKS